MTQIEKWIISKIFTENRVKIFIVSKNIKILSKSWDNFLNQKIKTRFFSLKAKESTNIYDLSVL